MHSALYLSSTLLFLPLLVLALPLPLCQDHENLPEHGAIPCESLRPANGWVLREGPLRREARSAEELADADAVPVLKPRDNLLERSTDNSESSTRRAIDWAFSDAGTEAPTALSHAVRALKSRWSTFLHNDLKFVEEPKESPPNIDATTAATADATLKEKRWTIPKGRWDILTVVDDSDDEYGPDSGFVSDATTTTELNGGS